MKLLKPSIFIHSNAIDRAVLVYLNYRSAYQTWKDEIDLQRESKSAKGNDRLSIIIIRTVDTSHVRQKFTVLAHVFADENCLI